MILADEAEVSRSVKYTTIQRCLYLCSENYVNPHPGSRNPRICEIHEVNQHLLLINCTISFQTNLIHFGTKF